MKYRIIEKLYANDKKEYYPQYKTSWWPFWRYYINDCDRWLHYNTYDMASLMLTNQKAKDQKNTLAAKVIRVRKFDFW